MSNQYTIEFPTLERLWSFKLTIKSEAYVIDVSRKGIKCSCSDLELKDAIYNYGGRLSKTVIGEQATPYLPDILI